MSSDHTSFSFFISTLTHFPTITYADLLFLSSSIRTPLVVIVNQRRNAFQLRATK
jgi:hypothetical protein